MKVLSNLEHLTSYSKLHVFSQFPTSPEEGMLVLRDDGLLYIYTTVEATPTWRPLNVQTKSYVHTQESASTSWSINHNLDSQDIIYFIYDGSSDRHEPATQTFNDVDNMTVTFTEAISGKAVIFAVGQDPSTSGSGGGDVDLSAVDQNIIPDADATRDIGSDTKGFNSIYCEHLYTSGNSLYVNGKQVLSDDSNTITVSTDVDQDLAIKTTGTGGINITSDNIIDTDAKGGLSYTVDSTNNNKNISFSNQSNGGAIQFTNSGTGNITFLNTTDNAQIQLSASGTNSEIDLTATTIDVNADLDVSGDLQIGGNLTVNGTTTYVNTTDLSISDNTIILNDGETGSGIGATDDGTAGISVDRGDSSNAILYFDDSDDSWKCGVVGDVITIGTGGGSSLTVNSTADANYAPATTNQVILCTSSADQNINLPSASTNSGLLYHVKKMGATGIIYINPDGTDTIDGVSQKSTSIQYQNITIICNGSDGWAIL